MLLRAWIASGEEKCPNLVGEGVVVGEEEEDEGGTRLGGGKRERGGVPNF